MGVQITIRDVPEKVRKELAARAAREGKSMQEYLKGELERLASRPTARDWVDQVRKTKSTFNSQVSTEEILRAIDADRR